MSGAYALGMVAGSDDAKSAVINAKGIEEREGKCSSGQGDSWQSFSRRAAVKLCKTVVHLGL